MVAILMMSAKLDTLDLLKINAFWNKGYDIIISFHDVTNKVLSLDSNYIVGVVMWPKFGNSRNYHNLNLKGFVQKKQLFWGVILLQVILFKTATRYGLEL